MHGLWVVSTGLLLGCAAVPVQKDAVAGDFVDIGTAGFAVFSEDGTALAVYLGDFVSESVLTAAQLAIEQATGCPVVAGSLQPTTKIIAAQLDCGQANSLFARARTRSRGKTARSGTGPPAQYLSDMKQAVVAAETHLPAAKQ